jgi:hypothetical protein
MINKSQSESVKQELKNVDVMKSQLKNNNLDLYVDTCKILNYINELEYKINQLSKNNK